MAKLSDTQLVLLSNAAKRDDGAIVLSSKLKGAAEQALELLLTGKLIKSVAKAGSLPLWKRGPDQEPLALVITPKGLEAIGIEAAGRGKDAAASATKPKVSSSGKGPQTRSKPSGGAKPGQVAARGNSKIGKVVEMLRKPNGATLKAIMSATGWQAHSVRGAISGAIKKRLGLKVTSQTRGDERAYQIGG